MRANDMGSFTHQGNQRASGGKDEDRNLTRREICLTAALSAGTFAFEIIGAPQRRAARESGVGPPAGFPRAAVDSPATN
jgi:hypothetical protein